MSCINMTWDCSDNQAACSNLNIFRAFVWSAPHKLRQLLVLCVNLNVVFRHRLMKQTHHFVCKLQSDFLGFQINFNFLCSKLGISFARKMPFILLDEENICLFFHFLIQIRNILNPLYKTEKENTDSDLIYMN